MLLQLPYSKLETVCTTVVQGAEITSLEKPDNRRLTAIASQEYEQHSL